MTDSLFVVLDDVVAGTVERRPGGRLQFDYVEEYRERPEPTPLSLSMPAQVRSHPDRTIRPWLWGLLPDNDAVLARWARQFHVSSSSPSSLLSTQIGEDCAGAVRFAPPEGPEGIDRIPARPGGVTWLTEDEIGQRLRDLRDDSTSWLGRSFTGQFSLAGAQAKTALQCKDGRFGVPSGSAATTHILKPAVAGLDDHDLNEHLCLDAARRAGLVAVRTEITRFGGESAVVVARYDRREVGGQVIRIHQEDLCQALGLPPTLKYQNDGGPGPAAIAKLFRSAMPPKVADDAVWRFADALIWNWLIAGTDAHAKNYSLLLAEDQVRLAPMYDVASALPYAVDERNLRFAMKIGGDYRVSPFRNIWPKAAQELVLDADALMGRVRALASRAPDAFVDAANARDVAALGRPLPDLLVDLVAERSERCSKLVRDAAPTA
ncbi:MAG: type II toxin-antitoxin system HipA family toxin [Acidimicrobiales bacterium]